jgi:hypothetical protein
MMLLLTSSKLSSAGSREPGAASLARIERKHPYKVVIEAVLFRFLAANRITLLGQLA